VSSVRAILCRSVATGRTSDVDLHYLLAHARQRNVAAEVTGLLPHDRGVYFQWLEGAGDAVEAVPQRLRSDPRHAGLTALLDPACASERLVGVLPLEPVVPMPWPVYVLALYAAGPVLAVRRAQALRSRLTATGVALVSATQRLRAEIALSRAARDLAGMLRSCPALPA